LDQERNSFELGRDAMRAVLTGQKSEHI
jgi:hypothetical protein